MLTITPRMSTAITPRHSASTMRGLISARNLVLARGGRAILADIDIDIGPREIVTVIGPNGAGKTTLVRALLGLETARSAAASGASPAWSSAMRRSASMWIAPYRSPCRASWRSAGALSRRTCARASEVGAGALAERQLSELSGGELQRVVLARA